MAAVASTAVGTDEQADWMQKAEAKVPKYEQDQLRNAIIGEIRSRNHARNF